MKTYLILILYCCCLYLPKAQGQEQKDSLVNKTLNHALYFNTEKQHYYFVDDKDSIVYDNLKFAREIMKKYQVLDDQNKMFYIDESLVKSDNTHIIYSICGNYDTYTVNIEEDENYFVAAQTSIDKRYEDSTIVYKFTFDSIPKTLVDSAFFLNKKMEFTYDKGIYYFGRNDKNRINYKRIIVKKEDKYGFWDNHEVTELFDEITMSSYFKLKKIGLWGYESITDIQYTVLEDFEYYLARFKYKDGRTGFIDKEGKEYFD